MAKKGSDTVYPLSALRALTLHTQLLTTSRKTSPVSISTAIVDLVKRLGYIQIDTLHVVNRAHYVTLWARLGSYKIDEFHQLVYTAGQRQLYEGWGHAASIIPLEQYRYHRWRTNSKISFNPSFSDWVNKDDNRALVAQALERIRTEGALRVGDFEHKGDKRGEWYDWRPSKKALEVLFAWGDLMVAERVNFQRVYDVQERV
ncbi:MAG: winged helix DNA-binding domain-containing protein, partial [Anaerolineales bacterium]|nr:winged helix DNA-binding domain-containing protein [Anaerolineales bacterium]